MMRPRFDIRKATPSGFSAMLGLSTHVQKCGLNKTMLELVKVRVSQINGCAYCVAMHVVEARKTGASEEQLNMLAVWREATLFSDEERAALAWAEVLTRLGNYEVCDDAYQQVRRLYSNEQVAELSLAVVEINGWNRLMMAAAVPPAHF